jgi:hypothetical protein
MSRRSSPCRCSRSTTPTRTSARAKKALGHFRSERGHSRVEDDPVAPRPGGGNLRSDSPESAAIEIPYFFTKLQLI